MESRVKLAGHPVHPMLIVFPLGLLATAVAFDIIYLVSGNTRWTLAAYYMVGAGVLGGIAAAVFGWLDWISIPGGTRAKRIGLWHGVGNGVVTKGPTSTRPAPCLGGRPVPGWEKPTVPGGTIDTPGQTGEWPQAPTPGRSAGSPNLEARVPQPALPSGPGSSV